MKILSLLWLGALTALASCGESEEQIRSDERARVLTEQLAEERGRNAAEPATESSTPVSTERENNSAPAEQTASPPAAQEQSRTQVSSSTNQIGSYRAYIGQDDLYNSSGMRLTQPWAILRQDRANFHRFGIRHSGDTFDEFFAGGGNREIMERMVANGDMSSAARNLIVNGDAAVRVDIYGRGTRGDYLDITVY